MVFESIVVDVLNRFLGDYVENLNNNQLKLGIWGGDVVLENLVLKQNALEELNIPVTTVYGHLGKLTLKIPWKNLYGASVEATVERLFLVVNPNAEVKYDPEKEEKIALESKMAELARVELAKKAELAEQLDETFVEKLVTQVIKNVQLTIRDIHIRYEDTITNPQHPFSFGITLYNLSVHTTDENWKQAVIQEAVTKIFKILSLEGLAIYWNPNSEMFSKCSPDTIKTKIQESIATKSFEPKSFQYALSPINATAKLKLNTKPEVDTPKFSIPKVTLSLHMEQLSVNLSKEQYQDVMLLADSMDRMSRGAPYRKYRPQLNSYSMHYKEWWKFAYKSVLEEEVRRRRRNWDWKHILTHRTLCKNYASAYQAKLVNKGKVTPEQEEILNEGEKILDLLNLVVLRQRIEMEVERQGKLEAEAKKARGWFGGWWSNTGTKNDVQDEDTDILRQFQNAMTPEEKAKLFRAIGYQENSTPMHMPAEYVSVKAAFQLDRLQLTLTDGAPALTAAVDGVSIALYQRPGGNAFRVESSMHAFTVVGVKQDDFVPQIVVSREVAANVHLLTIMFETNPIDKSADQAVVLRAQPLQVVYDAQTIIKIVEIFKPPKESTALTTLQAAAENKLSDLKEKSALGMQYAVHQHTFIALDVDVPASIIVVPQKGQFKGSEQCVVVKLGAIRLKSAPRVSDGPLNVAQLYKDGLDDDTVLREIAKHTYERITLALTQIQIVIAKVGEDWRSAVKKGSCTPLHLLQPSNLIIQIHKCLITDDPRLPKIKVCGELDKIAISISQDRVLALFEVLVSIPLPEDEAATQLRTSESKGSSMSMLTKYLDPAEKKRREAARNKKHAKEPAVQLTEVEAFFIIKEFSMFMNRTQVGKEVKHHKFLDFTMHSLEVTVTQRTYMLEARLCLGSVTMAHHREPGRTVLMLDTQVIAKDTIPLTQAAKEAQYLFSVTYSNVDKKCPDFRSAYGSVEQLIELRFTKLKMLLHLESLNELLALVNEFQTRLEDLQRTKDRRADAGMLETIAEESDTVLVSRTKSGFLGRSYKQVETIQLKVHARLDTVEIEFATDVRALSVVALQGARAGMTVKATYTELRLNVASLYILDPNPRTMHRDILKVVGGDVVNVKVVMFNVSDHSPDDVDMSIEAQLNTLHITFLNWFVSNMLEFMDNFQSAQQVIKEAGTQAAEAARDRAAQAYQNSTKVSLKVRMAAPLIIVPENSTSENALIIDLGRLNINNRFVNIDNIQDECKGVTIDELTLELEDVQVTCATLVGGEQLAHERQLLRPTSFTLLLRRSLSAWCQDVPDLDVSARLHAITISVGSSDYKSIMKILNQNLTEGQEKVKVPGRAPVPKVESKTRDASKIQPLMSALNVHDNAAVRCLVKFCFTMDSFVINLANHDPKLGEDVNLASIVLTLLSVKGRMFSDKSMHTSLLLVDCTLDDRRPSRVDKITRYLERRLVTDPNNQDKLRSMIDVTYTLKNDDTYIDLRVFSFNLILAVDFLTKISEFLTLGLAVDPPPPPPVPQVALSEEMLTTPSEKTDTQEDRVQEYKLEPKSTIVTVKADIDSSEKFAEKKSMLTVNIHVEKPDIYLVETLNEKSCDAFVLTMEVRFKLRQRPERMVADGGISALQVVTRQLHTSDLSDASEHSSGEQVDQETPLVAKMSSQLCVKDGRPRFLLEPTHVSVFASQPPGSGMHVDISITAIKINISPDMMHLMNRVLKTMSSNEDEDEEQKNQTIVYEDLWAIRPLDAARYWFLKTEQGVEALELEVDDSEEVEKAVSGEVCLLSSPSIVVQLELGIGRETIPLLVMQASLTGQLKDWSSDLYLESTWAMQVSYYNVARAEWEPLVEPVEHRHGSTYKYEPWELKLEVLMRSAEQRARIDATDEAATNRAVAQQLPNKTVTVSSADPLEITVTRTGMEVLTQLQTAFGAEPAVASASRTDDITSSSPGAPYILHNCTGFTVKFVLKENKFFTVYMYDEETSAGDYRAVMLEAGATLPLQLRNQACAQLKLNEPPPPLKLTVHIPDLSELLVIPVERADKRYFPLGQGGAGAGGAAAEPPRGIISDVVMRDAAVQIYLRSVLQVTNTLSVPVCVYYMARCGNEVRLVGEVAPGDTLRLPLLAVYTPTAEIFFSVASFTVSLSPFIWRELQQQVKVMKLLHCDSKNKSIADRFYMRAVGTMEQVFYEHTNRSTFASSCYDVVLKPAVKLQNCLPVPVSVSQLGMNLTLPLKPGEMLPLSRLDPNKSTIVILIQNYLEKSWVCTKGLPDEESELSVWSFESHDSPSVMTMDLGMHSTDKDGTQFLELYCPFWMINKTGFTLSYRKTKKPENQGTPNKNMDESGNVIFHPKEYEAPIMFSFRAKNFFGKKKATIRLEFGEWSEKFSLDVAGSSGMVDCRLDGRTYQVAVKNQLSFNSLTKMVIFTPFFLIINKAPFDIQYQEVHRSADPWQTVGQNSVSPLWPAIERSEKLLRMRVAGTTEICAPFLYTEQHSTCLKLSNQYGGLHVEVAVGEDGTFITVRQYRPGHAPALIVNFTRHPLTIYEKENVNIRTLPPMREMLYAWDNPTGPQILILEGDNKTEEEIEPRRDGIGNFSLGGKKRLYWVSFLNGLQRVVLITNDLLLARGAHMIGDCDVIDTELLVSIQGVGLSLVDDQRMQEIIYMSMSNSGIIWEQCKIGARGYKKVDATRSQQLEQVYQEYLNLKQVGETPEPKVTVEGKYEVDLEQMRILSPSPRLLRRTLEPGLWLSYGMSAHSIRIHARLHRLQVDEQLPLPTFPVVLAPVPPPRSVAQQDERIKPFVEVSILERVMEYTSVRQYKYYKVLIQEFHIKIDMILIKALLGMFPEKELTESEALELFEVNLAQANQPLAALAEREAASDLKHFYDNLHLSPLKVHLSFSMGSSDDHLPSFVGTVLQSIGVTLTDMNDVVFKLSYYERTYQFLSQKELMSQVQAHYSGLALKQLYVLVLGLDVIGNPYGLVVGLSKGVEALFYEPFQGAIQGPGEFAEGVYLGVRSLVGHTVGGAAGAMSRITGAMGSGLAALSLDKDYQRRRRNNMNKPAGNLQEGLARSGKGLVMGVVDGVTGVFTKPFEGARDEGVEGFLKGLGRGAVGLVARPTAGVVDFASGSLDAVKRAADLSEEIKKRRQARYLPRDTGVRPYSRVAAEGYKMLSEAEKGKFLPTDTYQIHVWVIPDKEVVMCTDKRLLYFERNQVFGGWQVMWTYLWTELPGPPTAVEKGVFVPTPKRKVLGMFATAGAGKVIFLYDEQLRKLLLSHCERLKKAAG